MKVISFSLYGDSPKYIVGMAKNIGLARIHYPGWKCRIYVDNEQTVLSLIDTISNVAGPIVPCKPGEPYGDTDKFIRGDPAIPPMLWRFMVADDPIVERFIIRDADSRIGPREAAAVQEWEQSGLLFSSLRDHPAHARGLNGGLWGGVWRNHNWEAPKMIDLWNQYKDGIAAQTYAGHDPDQHFLNTMIWPWAKGSVLQHDSCTRQHFPGSKPFPTKRDWPRFVGEVWSADDQPRDGDWQQIPRDQE